MTEGKLHLRIHPYLPRLYAAIAGGGARWLNVEVHLSSLWGVGHSKVVAVRYVQ